MSKLSVQKVPTAEDRKLPIFDEFNDVVEQIRVKAFKLFANRGFGEGNDLEDWLVAEREVCWPAAELIEEDDEFKIRVALAGFEPEDITVTATPRELIVKASRSENSEDRNESRVCWSNFRSTDVYRKIELPTDIDVDKVEAELNNGMLEIEAPKTVAQKAGRKNVKVSGAA